jgi:hypothetical protein
VGTAPFTGISAGVAAAFANDAKHAAQQTVIALLTIHRLFMD